MKNSYDIVGEAVREDWKDTYPQDMIAFFFQKYEWEDEWEWHDELVSPHAWDDYETTVFLWDFCEGQTCVKDLTVVPLDKVAAFYATQKGLIKLVDQ